MWSMDVTNPPANVGLAGADYMLGGAVAVVGLTANSTAEPIYYPGMTDAKGEPYTGAKNYTMTFKGDMPAGSFQGNRLKIRVTNGRRAEFVVIL